MTDIVIYHDKCIDGFTAAWACKFAWPAAQFVARNYGMLPDIEVAGANILIVDFSFPADVLEQMIAQGAKSIVILDHHKTAQEDLHPYLRFSNRKERFRPDVVERMLEDLRRGGYSPICAMFDMERSGAGMAWDYAIGYPRPTLVDLVEDRDLWRFQFGDDARHLHLALSSGEMTFDRWDDARTNLRRYLDIGRSIASYRDKLVAEICDRAWLSEMDGKRAIMVDCPYALASDVGHTLLTRHPQADFAALRVADAVSTSWSLRSDDDRADVSEIARNHGGGGHRNAAGFRLTN
ncbi:hypothetical protein [Novosphingobium colocasiae]|uniref:hypothetical protein n=1 Tax=Novosphingobium colocasiae TaxID=1256513 RepID=UPI0035B4CB56